MSAERQVRAWLLMTVGDDRQHGGNAGYDDRADVYYTWDDTVPNHAKVAVGDPIALWDKHRLLGISVVEEIVTQVKEKLLYKCPECQRAGIKERKSKAPRYKCYKCGALFDRPLTQQTTITEYRSRHDAAWTSLDSALDGGRLRALCESPKSQLSMRPLRWKDFREALDGAEADRALSRVGPPAADDVLPQGPQLALVRVRRGQRQFREHLLATQGASCALTGMAPAKALEAGHLYSYAELGVHHEHGGLLLRRDVHRLFDDGWLAVDPNRLRVDVSDDLAQYPQYAELAGRPIVANLHDSQVEWLGRHWSEHRAS